MAWLPVREELSVAPAWSRLFAARGWTSVHAVARECHRLRDAASGHGRLCLEVDGRPQAFYFKRRRFHGLARTLRALWGLGPWTPAGHRNEYRNLEMLGLFGSAGPRPVACGTRRRLGFLREQFILVEWMEGWEDLERRAAAARLRPAGRDPQAARRSLLALAAVVRAFHEAGWVHRDLFLRNILVPADDPAPTRFAFIDCRKGGWPRWLRRRLQAYDLAALDLYAAAFCSRGERLRFLRAWLGPAADRRTRRSWARRIAVQRRRLARAFLRGRRGRHPERRPWVLGSVTK